MAKKSFIKGIDSLLGNKSEIGEKQVNNAGKAAMKKQKKRTSGVYTTKKPEAQTGHEKTTELTKVINLKSRLTIDQSHGLKKEIVAALNSSGEIKLIAEECETIDLSFIQLCFSLCQTAQKENKKIEIEIPLNKEQTSILRNAGIYYEFFTGEANNKLSVNHND
jgi:hypothetical protein